MSEMEDLVAKVMADMQNSATKSTDAPVNAGSTTPTASATTDGKELGRDDYPLFSKHPDMIKSPTGKSVTDITLENVVNDKITADDLRITPATLKAQGQIAKSAGRTAIQGNFDRASELTAIPDKRLLEMYGSLRPYRSTKQELLDMADELEQQYNAKICATWVREAAKNYELRKKLKGDN
ncbi:diol dehydratase small subunit [Furfurilactobacillus siliginis]|uniref:Propanediol dehydratase small subunit n=1 Tax=Furfurilactobacillus siliginis TaxID=348151 RepID=A0A0R2L341_9LACO|nr:diol dehydratase small subunit [Furfurilactobacillus siliginis]KRN96216.1 propanediol dehydratase small subunit [Furfurilactobacillus siliginis]GEK27859.1 propanediol dehydratase small subunit [Furfurilactobacillus siliginis]